MSRVGHLLTHTVEHWRPVTTVDSMGGQSTVLTLLATLAGRRSQPTQAGERTEASADTSRVTDVVYLHPSVDVRRNDELRLDGTVLDVEAVYRPSVPIYLRVDAHSRQ
ncbi:MAG: phage head completion protein [Pseudonocardiaceae bacterium]